MKNRFLLITLALFIGISLMGCGTTRNNYSSNTAEAEAPHREMYPISETQAQTIMNNAMASEFSEVIGFKQFDLPYKGVIADYWSNLGQHRVAIRMIPAKGYGSDGKIVDGYVFDVSDKGERPISGEEHALSLLQRVDKAARAIAPPLPIAVAPKTHTNPK